MQHGITENNCTEKYRDHTSEKENANKKIDIFSK